MLEGIALTMANAHKTLQRNGVCWDCGAAGASPEVTRAERSTEITGIGWRCEQCNSWWPVKYNDLDNWLLSSRTLLRVTPTKRKRPLDGFELAAALELLALAAFVALTIWRC